MPYIEQAEAEVFLTALAGDGDRRHTFQTFDDLRTQASSVVFQHNGTLSECVDELDKLNGQHAGVFVTVQRTDLRGRSNENIVGLRALFVDSDTVRAAPLAVPVPPSIRVQSSPGKEHIYWLLTPGESLDDYSNAQSKLARILGTDGSVKDLARVMRLPGTWHCKDANAPWQVKITEFRPERRYTIQEVLDGFTGKVNFEAYVEWKLEGLLKTVRDAPDGERNNTLHKIAFIVKDLGLSEAGAQRRLLDAALEVGLSETESRRTIASAWKSDLQSNVAAEILQKGETAKDPSFNVDVDVLQSEHEADLALHLGNTLGGSVGALRVVDGAMYLYDKSGLWVELGVGTLKGKVQQYHAARVFDQAKGVLTKLKMTCKKRDATIDLLLHHSEFQAPDFWRDGVPGVLCNNGFISPLIAGDLEPRKALPEYKCRTRLPVTFDAAAPCPKWHAFLRDIFPNNPQASRVLQEVAGGALLGLATQYAQCVMLLGDGSNGKSVLLRALTEHLFPSVLVAHVPPSRWGHEYYAALLRDRLWNTVGELPSQKVLSSDVFKGIVAGDEIIGRLPYGQAFTFRPRAAHLFATNELPATRDHTSGYWRRFIVLPFDATFDGKVSADEIMRELRPEQTGIAAWAMAGAVRLLAQRGYTQTERGEQIKSDWRVDADPVATFLQCACAAGESKAVEIYSHFRHWCETAGRQLITARTFGARLRGLGVRRIRRSDGVWYCARTKPATDWDIDTGGESNN